MSEYKFGFIGCGNMGGALLRAVAKTVNPAEILVSDFDAKKTDALRDELGVVPSTNNEIAKKARFIVFGVKPQMKEALAEEIKDILSAREDRYTVISMLAGVETGKITSVLGMSNCPVIRIMPNMPAAVGEGMILFAPNADTKAEETAEFEKAFAKAGKLMQLPENLIDAGCALSGSGPAYVFMFIEALADGGVRCGLPRDKALILAEQTVFGSAKLAMDTAKHPGQLKDAVCSPAGTTIEGVWALENAGFRAGTINAVTAGFEKAKKLS